MHSLSVTSAFYKSKCFRKLLTLLNEKQSCIRVCGLTFNALPNFCTSSQNGISTTSSFHLFLHQFQRNQIYFSTHLLHTTTENYGRFGHRLVKLWEEKEYTTKPLKVYRTGGRLPNENWKGEIVPGKVWTAKLGGGLPRKFHWVQRQRMTAEEVENEIEYQEKIIKIQEDDNRSGLIALVSGPWRRRWVLCTENMKEGGLITNSARPIEGGKIMNDGDAYPLKYIPNGTKVCFVEFRPGKGGQIARSAGAFCTLVKKTEKKAVLKMPSKREIHVDLNCVAVIGTISNPNHRSGGWGTFVRKLEYGVRPNSGRHNKKDGRMSSHSNYASRPPIIIKDQAVLDKGTDSFN